MEPEQITRKAEDFLMHQGWSVGDAVDEAQRILRVFVYCEVTQIKIVSFRPDGTVYRMKITGVK